MKQKIYLLLSCAVLLTAGCTDALLTASFDVDFNEIFTVYAGTITATTVDDTSGPLMLDSEDFSANSSDIEKLESGKISSCVVTMETPNEDFSFAESVSISIQGEGLDKMLVASKSGIDAMATSVTLDVEDVNVVEHLKASSFTLSATSVTSEDVNIDLNFSVDVTIAVTADVL